MFTTSNGKILFLNLLLAIYFTIFIWVTRKAWFELLAIQFPPNPTSPNFSCGTARVLQEKFLVACSKIVF
jgi:hypothetical protein